MKDRELELAGIDVKEMMGRLMNNEKLARMIVGKFLQDRTYEDLCRAIACEDWKQSEFFCHTLKGICGNLALKDLFRLFQDQLALFRAGEPQQAVAMMKIIEEKYENAGKHLTLWLAE